MCKIKDQWNNNVCRTDRAELPVNICSCDSAAVTVGALERGRVLLFYIAT